MIIEHKLKKFLQEYKIVKNKYSVIEDQLNLFESGMDKFHYDTIKYVKLFLQLEYPSINCKNFVKTIKLAQTNKDDYILNYKLESIENPKHKIIFLTMKFYLDMLNNLSFKNISVRQHIDNFKKSAIGIDPDVDLDICNNFIISALNITMFQLWGIYRSYKNPDVRNIFVNIFNSSNPNGICQNSTNVLLNGFDFGTNYDKKIALLEKLQFHLNYIKSIQSDKSKNIISEKLTVPQIKKELSNLNIPFKSRMKKQELINEYQSWVILQCNF